MTTVLNNLAARLRNSRGVLVDSNVPGTERSTAPPQVWTFANGPCCPL